MAFLSKYEEGYDVCFSKAQSIILEFISRKLAGGKRFEDLAMLRNS